MADDVYWDPEHLEEVVSQRARILGPAVWAAATPDPRPVISFAGGLPDIPSLPGEILARAARWVVENDEKEALEYNGTFGPRPLRQALAERSTGIEGIPVALENVMIVSGSAHGIGIVCETLLDPGDIVLCESPNFPGSMRTMRTFGAELVSVPMDGHGLRVDALEVELKKLADSGRRAKFIYTIPNHQNPAGITLPLDRRQRIVELAQEYRTLILEDDAYGELWFKQAPPPSLYSLSGGDHVIKVSSFSKILATGLRMGWTMASPAITSRMASVRYDMGSSAFLGRAIAQAIRSGDLDRHVPHLREIYGRKLGRMEAALREHCGTHCTWTTPDGGFFLWLLLDPGLPAGDVQRVANKKGVIVGGGPQFFADGRATNHLRLAFSYVATEDIEEGVNRLAEAIEEVAAAPAAK
ncbi:MAG: PLP-dependent aminotransferase family protein [Dehalococcoidia bacterium]|nr:PLP-dependent aminotransferase family protein [Dehalococcoidia bacterium]MCB9485977.1 PLP-dependent aminotransferase family protein [Thermoflexaceae bacterium]